MNILAELRRFNASLVAGAEERRNRFERPTSQVIDAIMEDSNDWREPVVIFSE